MLIREKRVYDQNETQRAHLHTALGQMPEHCEQGPRPGLPSLPHIQCSPVT